MGWVGKRAAGRGYNGGAATAVTAAAVTAAAVTAVTRSYSGGGGEAAAYCNGSEQGSGKAAQTRRKNAEPCASCGRIKSGGGRRCSGGCCGGCSCSGGCSCGDRCCGGCESCGCCRCYCGSGRGWCSGSDRYCCASECCRRCCGGSECCGRTWCPDCSMCYSSGCCWWGSGGRCGCSERCHHSRCCYCGKCYCGGRCYGCSKCCGGGGCRCSGGRCHCGGHNRGSSWRQRRPRLAPVATAGTHVARGRTRKTVHGHDSSRAGASGAMRSNEPAGKEMCSEHRPSSSAYHDSPGQNGVQT